jgi:CubicO group peptidase (beta-lactamase class C family)
VDEGRATGIVVGVLEADGTRRIQAYGDAGPGALPLSAETVFEIGSISKVFTGTLLANMADDGLLSIEDPLQSLAPEGLTIPGGPERTIRSVDVATHRSALPRLPENMSPVDASNPYADYTVDMLYEFLNSYTLRRDVGAEYEYSNLAVGLLGHLLALKSGTDYEGLVKERILDPLGMDHTGITLTPEMERQFAQGHDVAGNVVSHWDMPTLAGAGALRSNVNDMLSFTEANVGEPTSSLERSMRVTHQVREPVAGEVSIGLNWHVLRLGDDQIVMHDGGTFGFKTLVAFDPDRGVGAVVLTNSAQGADDIALHLINNRIPLAAPRAPKAEEIEVGREIMERYVGLYELTPNVRITVTLGESGLEFQATNEPKFPMFAESETVFFLKVSDVRIEFVAEDGEATALTLHAGGGSPTAIKIR